MATFSKDLVNYLTIHKDESGQRLDNYLFKKLKGVPKSHIYRIIRAKEVKVNKQRVDAKYHIEAGDVLRIPPIRVSAVFHPKSIKTREFPIVFEDECLMVINKPAGVAVHGGSGVSFGVIEQLRQNFPDMRYLELVHRLDKETSGLLMIAKKRSALVKLHEFIRNDIPKKFYLSLVAGVLPKDRINMKLSLQKFHNATGEKFVRPDERGQYAQTIFEVKERFHAFTLLDVTLKTGRTHQIRVHLQALAYPIAGDERYGNFELNKSLYQMGLKRMFLHASRLILPHPVTGELLQLYAPLPEDLLQFLESLRDETQ